MKLFITRELPRAAMKILKDNFEIMVNPYDRVLSKFEIQEGTKWCDLLLCLLSDTIDRKIIATNTNLKAIINYAVGYDNIDMIAANQFHIPVTNTPGVLTNATADLTWALILAVARRIPEVDRFMKAGKFKGWSPMLLLGHELSGKTLGIIGAGRIGKAVMKRASGFDMNVIYCDAESSVPKSFKAKKTDMTSLLKESDVISLHVPLNNQTHHLIGEKELAIMKQNAILINTSRGPVIDEKAMVTALKENRIAGAGLDVYENEPVMSPGLEECSNAVLLPHVGSATYEARTKMGLICVENALAILQGKKPPNLVNPEIYD